MKLLVLAQTPPPTHGQSLMVKTLVEGLPSRDIAVHHVNLRISRDAADIGRWRGTKVFSTLAAAVRAIVARFRHNCDTLYYVPAPAKRGALYRDWILMLFCRPFFARTVLHWHAVGLGEWLASSATWIERTITRWLLGRAHLAIVLAPELAPDAERLNPRRIAVVPNCASDPGPRPVRETHDARRHCEVLFLGQCSRAKGLFATLEAVALANASAPHLRLTVAGGFSDDNEEREFHAQLARLPAGLVRYLGVVGPAEKHALFRAADLFCFPTAYPHEGQPVTLIEALAHDVPIVTTRWRAIPGMLPNAHVWFVDAHDIPQIAQTLLAARAISRPGGILRAHYLAHFIPEVHLERLRAALLPLDRAATARPLAHV